MAERRPDPWWHPVRTDPGAVQGLNVWVHLLAIGVALVATVVLGFTLGMGASALSRISDELAGVFAAIGIVLVFSVLFSWVGHLVGAVILHLALSKGKGGWAVALAGGLVVGAVLSAVIGGILPTVLGPFLALLHLAALRWLAAIFRPIWEGRVPPDSGIDA